MAALSHLSICRQQIIWFVMLAAVFGSAIPAYAHRFEKHFPVDAHPCVMVRNSSGTVTVHSWQKPEVQVIGDHSSSKVEVDAVQIENRVEVETHQLSENVSLDELTATYDIMVPQETTLQIHNDSGTVLVDLVDGDVTLEAVAATVKFDRLAGYVRVKTVGGSFTCTECSGRIEANSISGNLSLVRGQSSYVMAQTNSGNILLDSQLRANGYYHLKNVSGLIEMRFSPDDSFDLMAISYKGSVQNEATLKPRHNPRHLPNDPRISTMFGTYNEGKAHVELTSFSGKIEILKRP